MRCCGDEFFPFVRRCPGMDDAAPAPMNASAKERAVSPAPWRQASQRLHAFLRAALPARGRNIRAAAPSVESATVIPVLAPKRVLEEQRDLISAIRSSAVVRATEFDELITPLLLNVAAYLHTLPASPDFHHVEPQGLLRHSLEVGYYAHRLSKGRIFTDGHNPEHRNSLEPRWRLAAFLAGLLHDLGALARFEVRADDLCWNPLQHSLVDWAARHSVGSYQIRWRASANSPLDRASICALLDRLLPDDVAAQLQAPDPGIAAAFRGVFTQDGTAATDVLSRLVTHANAHSVDRYLEGADSLLGTARRAVSAEQHLLLAMRRLLRQEWGVNRRGGTAFVACEGVFLVWRSAGRDLLEAVGNEPASPLPRTPDRLADLLIERGIARANPGEGVRYWTVRARVGPRPASPMRCLLVPRPELLFDHVDIPRIAMDVLDASADAALVATDTVRIAGTCTPLHESSLTPHSAGREAESAAEASHERADAPASPPAHAADDARATQDLDRLRAWASEHGAAGAFLACLAEDLMEERLVRGEDYRLVDGCFAYRTPHLPTRHSFDPDVLLGALEELGWIEVDPIQPLVKVRTISNDPTRQFVVLRRWISDRLRASSTGMTRRRQS